MRILICLSLVVLFVLSVQGQTWTITTQYSSTGCSGNIAAYAAVLVNAPCYAQACISTGAGSTVITCSNSTPSFPSGNGFIGLYGYSDTNCQNVTLLGGASSSCSNSSGTSTNGGCSGKTLNIYTYANGNCAGSPLATETVGSGCYQTTLFPGVQSVQTTCSASCFHEDSEITYKGRKYSLDDLSAGKEKECTIPHVLTDNGVSISSSCSNQTLRLTSEHLIYTQRGLIEAGQVKVGDVVFQDMQEKRECRVEKVEEERANKYFGLNCEESVVLADGYKTSTFGDAHAVPSVWMKYASKLFGVKLASSIGDYLVDLLRQYSLF